jgi:DNA-directed RNA polymerase specialized sigma24 family protein
MAPNTGMEDILRGLSAHIASTLGALGYQYHGIDRDDLFQEVHIRIWKTIRDNGHEIRYPNAYIRRIVYSVFIEEINRINREKEALSVCGTLARPGNGRKHHDAGDDEAVRDALIGSSDDLRKARRKVIKLRLQGFSLHEIAGLNRWPYRKTCSVFYRGLKDLKVRLMEKGITYEDRSGLPL